MIICNLDFTLNHIWKIENGFIRITMTYHKGREAFGVAVAGPNGFCGLTWFWLLFCTSLGLIEPLPTLSWLGDLGKMVEFAESKDEAGGESEFFVELKWSCVSSKSSFIPSSSSSLPSLFLDEAATWHACAATPAA